MFKRYVWKIIYDSDGIKGHNFFIVELVNDAFICILKNLETETHFIYELSTRNFFTITSSLRNNFVIKYDSKNNVTINDYIVSLTGVSGLSIFFTFSEYDFHDKTMLNNKLINVSSLKTYKKEKLVLPIGKVLLFQIMEQNEMRIYIRTETGYSEAILTSNLILN